MSNSKYFGIWLGRENKYTVNDQIIQNIKKNKKVGKVKKIYMSGKNVKNVQKIVKN
jgi:exo-beta-1,3-glucanase (GH17 family)